jgi:hypothetical protein
MKTITISRKRWLRGDMKSVDGYSLLWCNDKRRGCCLGHAIHQIERCTWNQLASMFTPNDFFRENTPNKMSGMFVDFAEGEVCDDSTFTNEAIAINDNDSITDKEREKELKALFKKNGLKLVFTD